MPDITAVASGKMILAAMVARSKEDAMTTISSVANVRPSF